MSVSFLVCDWSPLITHSIFHKKTVQQNIQPHSYHHHHHHHHHHTNLTRHLHRNSNNPIQMDHNTLIVTRTDMKIIHKCNVLWEEDDSFDELGEHILYKLIIDTQCVILSYLYIQTISLFLINDKSYSWCVAKSISSTHIYKCATHDKKKWHGNISHWWWAAQILPLYSLPNVKSDKKRWSEESGKPLFCTLSYEKKGCRRGWEGKVSLNPKNHVLATLF